MSGLLRGLKRMASAAFDPALSAILRRKFNWGDWLAPSLILVTPFVNFLGHREYGLIYAENLLIITILFGLGLTASLLITICPPVRLPFLPWRLFPRPLVFSMFLGVFLDFQPEFKHLFVGVTSNIFSDDARCFSCIVAFFISVLVFFYIVSHALKQNAGTVFSVIFGAALAATILLPRTSDIQNTITRSGPVMSTTAPRSDMPPIVHIVLDEHIGIEGLPADLPGSAALRAELTDFYLQNGFRLYGGAFSQYFHTINSIPNLLNGATRQYDMSFLSPAGPPYVVTENAWFDQLLERGYRIRVYQSDYLNFCAGKYGAAGECATYPINGLETLKQLNMKVTTRAGLLINNFSYRTSTVGAVKVILRYMDKFLRPEETPSEIAPILRHPAGVAPLWAMATAEGLIGDLRNAKPGEAYFAHLLIPHVGFILDENCRAKPNLDTWYAHMDSDLKLDMRLSGLARPTGYVDRYVEYFKQVRCTRRMLDEIFRALSDAGVMDEATIIIHGDHGSRISGMAPFQNHASRLAERDVTDNFSTLFAIRTADVTAGYDSRVRSVQALFAELVLRRPLDDERAVVFLSEQITLKPDAPLVEFPFPGFE